MSVICDICTGPHAMINCSLATGYLDQCERLMRLRSPDLKAAFRRLHRMHVETTEASGDYGVDHADPGGVQLRLTHHDLGL